MCFLTTKKDFWIEKNKELGTQVEVSISPTTISIRNQTNVNNSEDLILECRVRYLSFMGISIDARFAIVYYKF